MILTEEQAREKRCCGPENASLLGNCRASECMAWRWQPLLADDAWTAAVRKAAEELGDKSPSRVKAAKHVNANRMKYGLPDKPYRGYCGLARKPEQSQ